MSIAQRGAAASCLLSDMPEMVTSPSIFDTIRLDVTTKPVFVDLFAGCGGLSLGLEQAGFSPILFSEINRDASATFIANRQEPGLANCADVADLTDDNLHHLLSQWNEAGIRDVDLVCGGPPCQGYSGIGIRRTFNLEKKDVPSNFLFNQMVRIISFLNPKAFLFENVQGLLTSRWTKHGKPGEVFRDVLTTLCSIQGYDVRWQLVWAKSYGVPQNRPRVLVVGIRNDILTGVPPVALDESGLPKQTAVDDGFLPAGALTPPDPADLFSDLVDNEYLRKKATETYPTDPWNIFQTMLRTRPDGRVLMKGDRLTEQEYSRHSDRVRQKFMHMIGNRGEILPEYRTKKFSQRVIPRRWGPGGPNITATSLPDDYVHFEQPRILTVREWARLQTFPDWYTFVGARTTGGRRRAGDPHNGIWEREVPKYTQIGNAVPVLMAKAIGDHLRRMLLSGAQASSPPAAMIGGQ